MGFFSNIFSSLKGFFTRGPSMPVTISAMGLANKIAAQCVISHPDMKWMLVDTEYTLIPASKLREIISSDLVNEVKYEANRFDCDDYALILAGKLARWSAGIIHVKYTGKKGVDKYHALNIAVLDNGKVVYIEPQTDEIFLANSDYEITFIYI